MPPARDGDLGRSGPHHPALDVDAMTIGSGRQYEDTLRRVTRREARCIELHDALVEESAGARCVDGIDAYFGRR